MSMFLIQSPEKDIFSAADLQWKDDVAYIPSNRILQFITGEELGSGTAPTKFKIRSSRTRKPGSLPIHRIRSQCWLKYTRYWCTYGPHDNRSKKSQVQSKVSVSPDGQERKRRRSACARGEDSARGCLCHFNVKIMYLWPDITQIHYVHRSHTDISGCICHGTLDPSAIGSRAQFAPKLSTDMRRWVLHQLYKNVSPKQILQEHKLVIQERQSKNKDHVPVRDDFLNKHDVLNISKRLAEDTFQHDVSEAEGVQTWIQRHPELVLFYQEENSSSNLSFILAIQTPWQEEKMITLGHQNVVACDATYGTDKFAFSFYTLLVFDAHQHAIPVAWIMTSSSKAVDIEIWLRCLKEKMNEKLVGWRPSCFVIDEPTSDVNSIRNVFDVPVFLSLWYLRRCWSKNLFKKVRAWNARALMFRKLGEIMYLSNAQSLSLCNMETHALKQVDMFMEFFSQETEFISYFQETWLPKIGVWIKAAQNLAHTNQDINCAIETYHWNFKARLRQEVKTLEGRRIDWFIHKLVKDVDSHFWFMDFSKRWGLSTAEDITSESTVLQAASIPDSNVSVPLEHEKVAATVISTKDPSVRYTVYNPDTEWACCDCEWARRGNMCKHQVKLLIMKGVIGGRAVQTYGSRIGAQQGVLNCLFLDHDKPVKEHVSLPTSTSNSTPCDLDLEDDDQDDNGLVVETRVDDEDIQRREDSGACVVSFPRFEDVFHALADVVGDIDNVMLAGHAANILLHAAHVISELKARSSPDIVSHGTTPFTRLLDDGFASSMKRAKPMMEHMLVKKLKTTCWGREDFEMQPRMESEETLVQSVPKGMELFRHLRADRCTGESRT
ncbi:hypothetical protein MPTK1_8g13000 [Marchantia polymorpha subsp. ruderalis]|uniref:SWIM-type domain-containing protein n=1 Tax=Marchantia polymorpha TaxID=3197 RepID=A0A2R6WJM9_MARPO|nr:hypothetical protein MARPO_0083s0021 [Marchantia polymorpha]BBN19715.1 hypothetical protein Mp_8g13000 [Marchantia polymorpha subsp. ruderalis]|eukprot:PTQ34052.1 hypothetical protein MARPO_0083s0021 [Marchantia polymorpha]